jgi:hypothetical protein
LEAKDDIDAMSQKLVEVNEIYGKVATFFGEDPKKTAPDQFFSVISSFADSFKVTFF